MRLTSPLNLPAPGRRQCLYVVLFDFADTCVFAKQSLGPILCDPLPFQPHGPSSTKGSPSPEVTGTFCRVPSPQVTRAPEATRLAYVCPFPVRSIDPLPQQAFLGSRLGPASLLPKEKLRTPLSGLRPTALDRDNQRPAGFTLLRPLWDQHKSTGPGMLTWFPSSTPFGLDLGSD